MSDSGVDVVGRHEIRVLLGGVGYEQVHQAISDADFPVPVIVLRTGELWHTADVADWIQRRSSRT